MEFLKFAVCLSPSLVISGGLAFWSLIAIMVLKSLYRRWCEKRRKALGIATLNQWRDWGIGLPSYLLISDSGTCFGEAEVKFVTTWKDRYRLARVILNDPDSYAHPVPCQSSGELLYASSFVVVPDGAFKADDAGFGSYERAIFTWTFCMKV